MKKRKRAARTDKQKPGRSTPKTARTSVSKRLPFNADEFIGSELDDSNSRIHGANDGYFAHLRAGIVEKLLPFGATVPGASNWVLMGPQAIPNVGTRRLGAQGATIRVLATGRITGIAVHPMAPSIMYVTAARGGVWKTTDAGATWTPMSDNEISVAIGAIGMAPSAPDTLYVGTGEGNIYYLVTQHATITLNESYQGSGLLKSTNGGISWALQGAAEFTGKAFYQIAVHPSNSDIAYAATTNGLYQTTNGGTQWRHVEGGLPSISSSVLAATTVVFHPTDGDKAWAGFWGSGVYECSNAASASPTWTAAAGFPTSNVTSITRISLAVSLSSPDTVYALCTGPTPATAYQGVYYTNGGVGGTWTDLPYSGPTPDVSSSRCVIGVDSSTPDIVYLGGVSLHKLVRNNVGGLWHASDIGMTIHVDHRCFATHPSANLTVFAGTDGGIYRTDDGGTTWSDRINKGICITQFEFLDMHPREPAYAFAGTQDNGTNQYRTSEVFYHSEDFDGGAVIVDPQDPRNVMIAPTKPSIGGSPAGSYPERSTQGGQLDTFSPIAPPAPGPFLFYPPMALDQTDEQRLAFGAKKVFLNSAQGTANWTSVSLTGGRGLVSALNYVNSNLIFATTHLGEVYRLVNSGSWTAVPIHAAPLPQAWIWDVIVSPSDPNLITVALGGFGTSHVWRGVVNNGGTAAVWTDLSGMSGAALPDAPVNAIALDPINPTHLFAGTDVGVFRSLDDGATWSCWREGLPNVAVYDLKLHGPTRLLRAATHGRGMWERHVDAIACNDVEIYLRDNVMHTGRDTAPSGQASVIQDLTHHIALNDPVYWWQCADVKIDATEGSPPSFQFDVSDVDFVTYEATLIHRNAQRGRVNRVYIQVHNRGIRAAEVTLKILYADATAFLPDLPADFWTAFPGDCTDTSTWTPIGSAKTLTVNPGLPTIYEWDWNLPNSAAEHSCLLVICDCSADQIAAPNKVLQIAALVTNERHIGLKNLHIVDPATADGMNSLVIQYQMRVLSSQDILRFTLTELGDCNLGLLLPSKLAWAATTTVKPTKVPAIFLKQVVAKMSNRARLAIEDLLLLQFKNGGTPVELSGLPPSAEAYPVHLVLTPTGRNITSGTLNVVQTGMAGVLGGTTFVIPKPRMEGRERRC